MELTKTNDVVSIEYVIADKEGNILDSSQEQILHVILGSGQLPSAVDEKIINKKHGDMVKFDLSAKEAYGEYQDSLILELGPESFTEGLHIYEGMTFQRPTENGPQTIRVSKIEDNLITADANHPLAGKDISWHIVIVGVRPATEEEILRGTPDNHEQHSPCPPGEKPESCDSNGDCGHQH